MSHFLNKMRFFKTNKQSFAGGHGVTTEIAIGKTVIAVVGNMIKLYVLHMV